MCIGEVKGCEQGKENAGWILWKNSKWNASSLSFLREMRKKTHHTLHRHFTPDWTKSWKIYHWEQSCPVCRAYDLIHTGNILMPKWSSQRSPNISWSSGSKTSQIFQCRNKIANSNPHSALINTNAEDLKWSNSEFILTLHQQNRLFAPLPYVFWSFIRLCKQSLLKWKASQKCWASLFFSNKRGGKKLEVWTSFYR